MRTTKKGDCVSSAGRVNHRPPGRHLATGAARAIQRRAAERDVEIVTEVVPRSCRDRAGNHATADVDRGTELLLWRQIAPTINIEPPPTRWSTLPAAPTTAAAPPKVTPPTYSRPPCVGRVRERSNGGPPGTRTPNLWIKSPKWTINSVETVGGYGIVRAEAVESVPVQQNPCW